MTRVLLASLAMLVASVSFAEQTADEWFATTYEARIKDVGKTPNPSYAQFAKVLIEHADKLEGPQQAKVLNEAFQYAIKYKNAASYETAVTAMEKLSRVQPDFAAEAQLKMIDALELQAGLQGDKETRKVPALAFFSKLQNVADAEVAAGNHEPAGSHYARANKVAGFGSEPIVRQMNERAKALDRLQKLKGRLSAKPSDQEVARDLVRCLLVDLGTPSQAAKYLPALKDEALRRAVDLACKGVDQLNAAELIELGRWYDEAAKTSGVAPVTKATALSLAGRCYERVIALGTKGNPYIEADIRRVDISRAMKALPAPLPPIETAATTPRSPPIVVSPPTIVPPPIVVAPPTIVPLVLAGHQEAVIKLGFSPDGKFLVSKAHGEKESCTLVWDLAARGQMIKRFDSAGSWAFSGTGSVFATCADQHLRLHFDGRVPEILDTKKWTSSRRFDAWGWGENASVAVSEDGRVIAASTRKALHIGEIAGKDLRKFLPGPDMDFGFIGGLSISRTGKYVAAITGWTPKVVHCWEVASGEEVYKDAFAMEYTRFFPDEDKLLTYGWGNWRVVDLKEKTVAKKGFGWDRASLDCSRGIAWDPAGKSLAVKTVDPLTAKTVYRFEGHKAKIREACLSNDGSVAASASEDGVVFVWNGQTGQELLQFKAPAKPTALALSNDARRVAVGCADGTIHVQPVPAVAGEAKAAGGAPAAGAGAKPVTNGDFETIANGQPAGWEAKYGPIGIGVEDGNHFLTITHDKPKTAIATQRIALDPAWTSVTVKGRMRIRDFQRGNGEFDYVQLGASFGDEAGKRVGGFLHLSSLRDNCPWRELSQTYRIPPGAKSITLTPGIMGCAGTADFDDIEVVPTPNQGALLKKAKAVDLLARVDVQRDTKGGHWERTAEGLVSGDEPPKKTSKLKISCPMPREYELHIQFSISKDWAMTVVGCPHPKGNFSLVMNYGDRVAFEHVNGLNAGNAANPTIVRFRIVKDRKYDVLLRVRDSGIVALIDGEAVCEYKGDWSELAQPKDAPCKVGPDEICIATYCRTTVHKIDLTALDGK